MDYNEAYTLVKTKLDRLIDKDDELNTILDKLKIRKSKSSDSFDYAKRLSELLGKAMSQSVDELVDFGLKEAVAEQLLKEHYQKINAVAAEVLTITDESIGINIAPAKAPFPADRVKKVAHSLEDPTVALDTIRRRANTSVSNVGLSYHDDFVKENVKKRGQAGLAAYIVRKAEPGCCDWCRSLTGRYLYGTEPGDVYRRHTKCKCAATYEFGRERQNIWKRSQKWTVDVPDEKKNYSPTKLTPEQAKELEQKNLNFKK